MAIKQKKLVKKQYKSKQLHEITNQEKVNKAIYGCLKVFDTLQVNPLESNMVTSYLDHFALAVMHKAKMFKTDKEENDAKQEISNIASKLVSKTMRKRQEDGVDEGQVGKIAQKRENDGELGNMYR